MASGLLRQELTHPLVYELPPVPTRRSAVPVLFPLGPGTIKGAKPRTTWVDHDALVEVRDCVRLERAAAARCSGWQPSARLGGGAAGARPHW